VKVLLQTKERGVAQLFASSPFLLNSSLVRNFEIDDGDFGGYDYVITGSLCRMTRLHSYLWLCGGFEVVGGVWIDRKCQI
jgi:hypothetical protein